jgi:2-keto-4-pentenoate hydratase/2-oxohepta-3-ene-1,7-dioic acid hydratase in catechol pathway
LRLYRYVSRTGGLQPRLAVAGVAASPVDLIAAWERVMGGRPDPELSQFLVSTLHLIQQGRKVWSEIHDVARAATEMPELRVDLNDPDVRLLCPIDTLSSLRDFLAFEDHVENGARRRGGRVPEYWYEAPLYYKGNHHSTLGPDEELQWPSYTDYLDLELELAMIIGKRGRDIGKDEASEHIFGFTIFNDFSARDVQMQEVTAWLGPAKGKDFANSFGPCIVTADELGTEPDLEMICRVNGQEWGRARSSASYWSWADMIAHVSNGEDVYPGDVYGSGTPGGCCGLDLERRLSPGDVVELEIEKIGVLRNKIGPKRAQT